MSRIAPYARISDTDEDRAPGLDRQLRVVYPLIESRGGTPTEREYVDNDKSAYQEDVIRDEGFEPWLADFIAGKNDGVAAFDLDRLFRQTTDLNRVIKAYCHAYFKQGRPKPVLWLPSSSIDLTDEDGQMMATVLVAMAKNSSGKTAKRITTFYRDEALKGKIFSNYPAFYRNPDGSINELKKAIALKAVQDALNGIKPHAIAAEWRDAGITTARGGRVTGETARRILISPGIAGIAVYKREIMTDTDGKPIMRVDGGIVDEPTWRQLCLELKTDENRRNRGTKALLSKKTRCGLCGHGMSRMQKPRKSGWFAYNCYSLDAGGCGKLSISGPRLDAQVEAEVLAILSEPLEPVEPEPFAGTARIEEITAMIAELMTAFRSKTLSGATVFSQVKELEDEKASLKAQQTKHERSQRRITSAAEEWPDLDIERKRAIIDELFEAIIIKPATGKPGLYDPGRVEIIRRSLDEAVLSRVRAILNHGREPGGNSRRSSLSPTMA